MRETPIAVISRLRRCIRLLQVASVRVQPARERRPVERVWAIEDRRHVSARLEAALIAAAEWEIRVPAAMTASAAPDSTRSCASASA